MADTEIELTDDDLVRALSIGRVVIGGMAVLAPRRFARAWTGESDQGVTGPFATRSLGARDVAIGLGTLFALERGAPVKSWIQAQAVADGADALGTLANFKNMPPLRRWMSLAIAGGACALGVRLQAEFD